MQAHFTTSDYEAIAAKIYSEVSDETAEHVIEFEKGGCLLIVQVSHRVECRDEIGGSHEGNFEMLAVVDEEEFDILTADCFDNDGNEVNGNFDANELYKLLN